MCENREGEKNNEFTETNKSKNRRNYELVEKKLKFSANLRKVSTQMETHRETERFLGGHEVFSFLTSKEKRMFQIRSNKFLKR